MDALEIKEKNILLKLPMIATELDDLAAERELVNRRRK